ncbi:MAG: hypothetical protein NXI19_10615 [Alphaproteobacteria bacterium]|nr:hypothetical protein [Alphaproteobacteria bacterium]
MSRRPFFVGYLAMPRALAMFLAVVTGVLLGTGAVVATVTVQEQNDWGDGGFQWGEGRQTRTGIVMADPYPVLFLPPNADHPFGQTLPLSGAGKTGVQTSAREMQGAPVDVSGIILRRDDFEMIQVSGNNGLVAAADPAPLAGWSGPEIEALGRVTLKGELLDSKCFHGAMRPGEGKTHKLCANLCLIGGVPLTFMIRRPDGSVESLLMADQEGQEVTGPLLDHVSQFVELTGELERRGDLLVFKVDPETVRRL